MDCASTKGAVVLATNHDWETEFVFGAADLAQAICRRAGFDVVALVPFTPADDVNTAVVENRVIKGIDSSRELVVGYMSAHGSIPPRCLLGSDDREIFDAQTATVFSTPFLVFAACLKGGNLAVKICARVASATIIGYRESLAVPTDWAAQAILGPRLEVYQQTFHAVLVQPLVSRLIDRKDNDAVKEDTKKGWDRLYRDARFPDRRVKAVALTNRENVDIWSS